MTTLESKNQIKNWVSNLQEKYRKIKLENREIFVDIKGYEGLYQISNHGRVYGIKHGYILRPDKKDKYGHQRVKLSKNGIITRIMVHRLVLIHFDREPLENEQCRHLDGNTNNNHINNLKWGTVLENQRDRLLHGTHNIGIQNAAAKLSEEQVKEIISKHKTGNYFLRELAEEYKVSSRTISLIVRRESWKHI